MPTVPETLRAAREAASLTVQQVAESTKLKTEQVRALDQGDYSVFPAPIYIRGSIRTYARLLKLDVPSLMTQLEAEFSGSREFSDPPPLTPPAGGILDWMMLQFSKMDWRVAGGLGLLLIVLMVSWSFIRPAPASRKADPLAHLGPGLYSPKASPQSGQVLPLVTNAPESSLPRVLSK
ncbi:MAG: helix-turn-helix domain-containing protein [Verrucomicrobia bacterium]|nr:helix-turn-helix domain-containing protein [Verrucomicrobiota bacterium]MBI3868363.1 helix-turn-helix domain-containing protein [Verrucomicrobiota bacterium]